MLCNLSEYASSTSRSCSHVNYVFPSLITNLFHRRRTHFLRLQTWDIKYACLMITAGAATSPAKLGLIKKFVNEFELGEKPGAKSWFFTICLGNFSGAFCFYFCKTDFFYGVFRHLLWSRGWSCWGVQHNTSHLTLPVDIIYAGKIRQCDATNVANTF